MSIILSTEGNYWGAAVAILVAMIFDGLDGWMAKILHAVSTFGEKLDSRADIVSFGIAPAMILYGIGLKDIPNFGWVVVIIFPIAGAIRLGLFNSRLSTDYFIGLPITSAGGITAALVVSGVDLPIAVWVIVMVLLTTLMVSRVRYPDIKRLNVRYARIWEIILLIVAVTAVALINPRHLLFLPFIIYILYGFKNWALSKVRTKGQN